MESVEVVPAGAGERRLLENLFQLYSHEMSAFWSDPNFTDLSENGQFQPWFVLDDYWRKPRHSAFVLRADGRLAGFALVDDLPRSPGTTACCIREFFVVRKYRRTGVGRRAAHALFDRHPGPWEVAVMRRNAAAARFWRATARAYPALADLSEVDSRAAHWDGPVFRFIARPAEAPASADISLAGPLQQGQPLSLEDRIRNAAARVACTAP